jgi:hypothetical protein
MGLLGLSKLFLERFLVARNSSRFPGRCALHQVKSAFTLARRWVFSTGEAFGILPKWGFHTIEQNAE